MKQLIKFLLIFIIIIIIGLSIATTLYMQNILHGLPSLSPLKDEQTPEYCDLPTSVYASREELIAVFTISRQKIVSFKDIPKQLIDTVILIKDPDFYQHKGVNFKKIISLHPLLHHYTITEELIMPLFLKTHDNTLRHRIEVAILAMQAEKKFTKDEIISRYLNKIFLGHGSYGIGAGSWCYFHKQAKDLNLAECALLVGLLSNPEAFSPFIYPDKAEKKQDEILDRMEKAGFITNKQHLDAKDEMKRKLNRINSRGLTNIETTLNKIPYFTRYIRQQLSMEYGDAAIYKQGLKVYTSLDLNFQRQAEMVLGNALAELNKNNTNTTRIEGALIAIDPTTGYIKAMVGGSGVTPFNQLNRVTNTHRQPGSAFKPFVYAAAIDAGFTAATLLNDSEVSYGKWKPKNYEGKFLGTISLRYALEQSINVASVKLLNKIGAKKAISCAQRMGIKSRLDADLTLCLGVSVVTPLEMAGAYTAFANNGVRAESMGIKYIKNYEGKLLDVYLPKQKQVLSPQTTYIMLDMLKGVVERGTAKGALRGRLGREAAGKTGTSNNCVDAWFIGFIPQLLVCVWIGYDKGQISMGKEMCGGEVAAPIWRDFMLKVIPQIPVASFQRPYGIIEVNIDPFTGLKATQYCPRTKNEIFIAGTEPKGTCTTHVRPREWYY
ncbi:MAG: PBP1A family penicillin-binding protein [Candidatus Desantisbacteria bacterium]